MGEDNKELPQPTDPNQQALEYVKKLIETRKTNKKITPNTIRMGQDGRMLSEDTADIINSLDQIPLSDAEAGDVVWWTTQSGTKGYFIIEEPYGKENGQPKYGKGRLLLTRTEGHPLGNQQGEGHIIGSSLGSMIKIHTLVRNLSCEYVLKQGEKSKPYVTTPIEEMGLIKSAEIPKA